MIWKTIKLNLDDLYVLFAVVGGVFLIIQLVVAGLMLFLDMHTILLISSLILPLAAGILSLIINVLHPVATFETMVRYSVSRRKALTCTVVNMAFETAAAFALALVLAQAERLIALAWQRVFPGLEIDLDLYSAIPLWGVLLAALGTVLAGLICGAILQRFGRRGFWILWGLWMAVIVLQGVIPWHEIFALPWLIPCLMAVLLLLAGGAVWSLLRASVKA